LGTRLRWIAIFSIALASLTARTGAAQEPPESGSEADAGLPAGIEAPTPLPPPPSGIEAIEVSGERVDNTDVQDEAQAISAFSAADLDKANIVNIDSLQFNVPGLHVGQSGQQAIVTLRGVGTENASITGEPGVAFHVDGVNYAQPAAARVAFFDLESLDIKRGPQGLQGGKNSTSGTINVVTRKPHDEYEVSGDYLMGNYDRQRVRGAVNAPFAEWAAMRTAIFWEDRDGFLDVVGESDSHDAFDQDDFGLRSHVRLNPAESLEVLLSYNYFQQGGAGPQADIAPIPRVHSCGPSVLPLVAACVDPRATEDADPRSIYLNFPSEQDSRFWGWTARAEWDVPDLPWLGETRLTGIGGFQTSEVDFLEDFDAVDIRFTEIGRTQEVYQNTAELQWSGALAGERVEWLTSLYYARESGDRFLLALNYPIGDQGAPPTPLTLDQGIENTALGAALHTTFHLAENVRFQLGGRAVRDEKRTSLFRQVSSSGTTSEEAFIGCEGSLGYLPAAGDLPTRPERGTPWCSDTFRGQMWGTGLDWRPFGGDHLLYARLDRGYKSGGFRSGQRGTYLPEKIWAYAAGSKSEFFDSRLQLNLEGFFYNYQDMQLVILDGTTLRTENADTRMWGWDLEARAAPIEGLDLSAVVSFLDTEIQEYYSLDGADFSTYNGPASDLIWPNGRPVPPNIVQAFNLQRLNIRDRTEDLTTKGTPLNYSTFNGCYLSLAAMQRQPRADQRCGLTTPNGGLDDFSGNELSRAPRWTITLSGGYDIPIGRLGTLTPRVQYTWRDDTYFRAFNRDFDLQEAYHLTDAKLEWRSPEERWEAEVFVQNIEDEAPMQNILVGSRTLGSPPLAWYGPPRFYGVRVGFKY
jgi:iron complex outermembrane receptor protein